MNLTQLREELAAKAKAAQAILDQYNESEIPAERYDEVTAHMRDIRDLRKRLEQVATSDESRGELGDLLKLLNDPTGGVRHPATRSDGEPVVGRKRGVSLGEHIVTSDIWSSYIRMVAPNGKVSDGAHLQSPPIPVSSKDLLYGVDYKALITGASATSAGAMVFNDVLPGLVEPGRRPLTIRDVITIGRTTSDVVEYAKVTGETNAAAPVAEATTQADGLKPESSVTMAAVTAPVKTIAHWIAVTRRALADAAQLASYIDGFLTNGVEEELEDQVVAGNGTGNNFTGILSTSGIQTQAWDTDLLTTLRKARTKVRTVGRQTPTAYLLNPSDWEAVDLLKDSESRYYFGGPSVTGTPRLWGLPVIECEAVPVGTGIVGAMNQAVLWDREDAQVLMSESHADFFLRNIVVFLGELRAAFGILRPAAFVSIDLTAL